MASRSEAERRIHLEIRVVVSNVLIEQSEVVRRDLAGDACFGAFAAAHRLERVGSGEMSDVQS